MPMSNRPKKLLMTFSLDPSVQIKLARVAEIEERSKSNIANMVLREFLSKYPDEEAPVIDGRLPFRKRCPAPVGD